MVGVSQALPKVVGEQEQMIGSQPGVVLEGRWQTLVVQMTIFPSELALWRRKQLEEQPFAEVRGCLEIDVSR